MKYKEMLKGLGCTNLSFKAYFVRSLPMNKPSSKNFNTMNGYTYNQALIN